MVKFTLGRGLGLVAKGLAKTGSLSIIGIGKVSAKLIRNEEVSTKIKNISTEMAVKADEMATVVVPKIEEFTDGTIAKSGELGGKVGKHIAKKLNDNGMFTMGDVARKSLENEDLLFKLFGVNAEFLIDHAWGYEPCTIEQAKSYKPSSNSISQGQVLHCPYDYKKTKLIVREMTDALSLDLVEKNLTTNQLTLTIQYDIDNLKIPSIRDNYDGEITIDYLGRSVPKHSHGTANIEYQTSSTKTIMDAVIKLYDRIINPKLLVRKINISANNLIEESKVVDKPRYEQYDLFSDYSNQPDIKQIRKQEQDEKKIQIAMLKVKKKYGKNAILKGMNLEEGATAKDRNEQVGGHKG